MILCFRRYRVHLSPYSISVIGDSYCKICFEALHNLNLLNSAMSQRLLGTLSCCQMQYRLSKVNIRSYFVCQLGYKRRFHWWYFKSTALSTVFNCLFQIFLFAFGNHKSFKFCVWRKTERCLIWRRARRRFPCAVTATWNIMPMHQTYATKWGGPEGNGTPWAQRGGREGATCAEMNLLGCGKGYNSGKISSLVARPEENRVLLSITEKEVLIPRTVQKYRPVSRGSWRGMHMKIDVRLPDIN